MRIDDLVGILYVTVLAALGLVQSLGIDQGRYGATPFLLLYTVGFLAVGGLSVIQTTGKLPADRCPGAGAPRA